MNEALQARLSALPDTPGVYLFKDGRGRVLYIGKAKSLRDRVGTYFTPSGVRHDARLAAMVARIEDLETIDSESDIEAMMLESKLIKGIRPRYNLREKDDKSFGCLVLTGDDDFPKVHFARETDAPRGERFGPFPNAPDLRRAIRVLQGIFRFATCSLTIRDGDPKRRFFRPCLLYSIRRCTAPCGARVGRREYLADIASLRRFLQGDKRGLIDDLARRMEKAARALEFERAAELRDQVRALESLTKEFSLEEVRETDVEPIDPSEALEDLRRILELDAPPRTLEACDAATIQGADSVGSVVTFVDGLPFKDGYRHFRIRRVRGVNDFDMIREVVGRRFARLKEEGEVYPDLFLVDGGLGQLSVAAAEARRLGVPSILLALAKKEETLFRAGRSKPVRVGPESLGMRLLMHARDEAHRFAQRYHHILRRKGFFPKRKRSPPPDDGER